MNKSIYEVSRNEYKGFVSEIKPECREVSVKNIDKNHIETTISSKKNGTLFCSRLTCTTENNNEPEKYYIFNMPENDERGPAIPVVRVVLETKEEVQKLFNYISEKNKHD